jgi:hypothetical protein
LYEATKGLDASKFKLCTQSLFERTFNGKNEQLVLGGCSEIIE